MVTKGGDFCLSSAIFLRVVGDEPEAQVRDDGKECRASFVFGFLNN